MCGRYAATANPDELVEVFDIDLDATAEPGRSILAHPQTPAPGRPDYNMAPTKQAPVVMQRPVRSEPDAGPVRQLRLLTWGLVPPWSKDPRSGVRMINARAETVLESRSYAGPARSRRCLVPAQGWYEWQVSPLARDERDKPLKQPFFICGADQDVVAFAGLYEFWRDKDVPDSHDPDAWLSTFTIITTAAEPGLDRIHDRQPMVLTPERWAAWLDPGVTEPDDVARLLVPAPAGRFRAYPVSRAVSSSRSNGPHLLDPAPAEDLVGVVDPETGEIIGG
jgi:putative SOS response-associated peptidase YedK